MKLRTAVRLARSGDLGVLLSLPRLLPPYYRVCFLAAAAESGLLRRLAGGPVALDRLVDEYVGDLALHDGLEAWLDLGAALGVLRRGPAGYGLRSRLARALADVDRDAAAALIAEAGALHHRWITEAPARAREGRPFQLRDVPGELVARSSRTLAPFVREAVEDAVPARGPVRLLEIGCGTGVYIRHAADRNPALTAVGLDLEPAVVALAREHIRAWGLAARVRIDEGDVRRQTPTGDFDVATLHNNIYYFPVAERVGLLSHVRGFLKPGGRLVVTTACRGGSPTTEILNVWGALTAGCGRLPGRDELAEQLRAAGCSAVRSRHLIPGERIYAFVAVA
jgi:4-hydroxy-2,2'-bipyrrole-5-carbaldehyde O-methyltransferase